MTNEADKTNQDRPRPLSRREFIKEAAAKAAGGIIGVSIGSAGLYGVSRLLDKKGDPEYPFDPVPNQKTPGPKDEAFKPQLKTLNLENRQVKLEIFPENPLLSSLDWAPDGHTSFIKSDWIKVWIAAGTQGFMAEGKDFKNLYRQANPVISPSRTESFDRDYAAPGSVIPGKNEHELLMFYHGEYHQDQRTHFPFTAGIGVAKSTDGGKSFQSLGQILAGQNERKNPDKVYGAGQPCAIIRDGYIYLYYVDWNDQYPDSIHLARAPIDSDGAPGSWEKSHEGKFKNDGPKGKSTPVINAGNDGYSALPSISYNSKLDSLLGVYESKFGFEMVTSKDGISWSSPQRLLQVKTGNNNPKKGEYWYSYPTLLSPNQDSDRETDDDLLLLYSEGRYQQSPHTMRARQIKLST